MSSGKYTAMSFSFNCFSTSLIYTLQSSRNLCIECFQLVLDLSLKSPRKLLILRDFTVHFDILDFVSLMYLAALNLFMYLFIPDSFMHVHVCTYLYVHIYRCVYIYLHS